MIFIRLDTKKNNRLCDNITKLNLVIVAALGLKISFKCTENRQATSVLFINSTQQQWACSTAELTYDCA